MKFFDQLMRAIGLLMGAFLVIGGGGCVVFWSSLFVDAKHSLGAGWVLGAGMLILGVAILFAGIWLCKKILYGTAKSVKPASGSTDDS